MEVCPICHKEFDENFKTQVFCSRYCSNFRRAKAHEWLKPVTCPLCGKEFNQMLYDQEYCNECAVMVARAKVERRKVKKCPQCGKVFITNTNNQRFCSAECRVVFNNKREPPNRKIQRIIHMKPLDKMSKDDLLHYGILQSKAQLKGKR